MTSKPLINSLRIVFYALLAGQVFFLAVTAMIHNFTPFVSFDGTFTKSMLLVCLFAAIGGIMGGKLVTRRQLDKIEQQMPLEQKVSRWRGVFILRLAMLEAPSFMAIVGFMLTANFVFAALSILLMAVFATNFPTYTKISAELNLSDNEGRVLLLM